MASTQRLRENAYKGYRSYQYLEPARDYEDFDLVPEIGLFPPYADLDLSDEQEARAARLLDESLVISLHDHPSVLPQDLSRYRDLTRTGRDRTGYEGLAASGLSAVFDNFLACSTYITSQAGWKWTDVIVDLGMRYCDLAQQDFVVKAGTVQEVLQAHDRGQIALIPGLEAATMIENEVDRIDVLFGLGIRQMGVVYSEANTLGSGLKERNDGGLTYFGERAVERMNRLGMAVDVAHCGDRTSLDVIKSSQAPVLITHAGARSVWPTPRMKPDDVLRACAERGGIIGIEAAPHTTLSRSHPRHSLLSVMDHFVYLVDLLGLEHVTFGPDTIFGDHVGLHEAEKVWQYNPDPFGLSGAQPDSDDEAKALDYPRVEYVAGLENPSECFQNIIRWLVRHGYSDDEIRAVVGGNTIRVLEAIWR